MTKAVIFVTSVLEIISNYILPLPANISKHKYINCHCSDAWNVQ